MLSKPSLKIYTQNSMYLSMVLKKVMRYVNNKL